MKRFGLTVAFAFLVFIGSLCLYTLSASRYPTGYADSDELITAGHLLSVAHPPGYGVNILLIGMFQRLLSWLSAAYATNLLASVLHALTLTVLFAAVIRLTHYLNPGTNGRFATHLGAAFGILTLGLSGLFWMYGAVIEVMSLGDFFIALILYWSIKWLTTPSRPAKYLLLTAATYGLGVAHLQPIILLGPGLLCLLLAHHPPKPSLRGKIKALFAAMAVSALLFFIGSATILPLNARKQPHSWHFINTASGFMHMVFRKDYQGNFIDKGMTLSNSYFNGTNIEQVHAIPKYLATLWNQFAGVPLILVIVGLVYIYLKYRTIAVSFFFIYAIAGLLFGSYVTVPNYHSESLEYRLLQGTAHRQYLMGMTVLGLFTGVGGYTVSLGLSKLFSYPRFTLISVAVTGFSLLTSMLVANWTLGYQRNNDLVYRYGRSLLAHTAPNSAVICSSDSACFSLYYLSLVENFRPDVVVLSSIPKDRHNFLNNHPEYIGFAYPENPFFYTQEVIWNTAHRPTYLVSVQSFYTDYIGLNGDPYYLYPEHFSFRVYPNQPKSARSHTDDEVVLNVLRRPVDNRNFLQLSILDYFAGHFQSQAQLFTKYGSVTKASQALDYALSFNSNDSRIFDWRSKLDAYAVAARYKHETKTRADYLKAAIDAESANDLEKAYTAARKAYYLDPTKTDALLLLERLYEKGNYPQFANMTREHASSMKQAQ